MYMTVVTLSCSLLAQPGADTPLVPVQSTERRTSSSEMVTEALTLPDGATLTGQPLTLLKALSSARGSRQQAEATHAYWRLTTAMAEYCSRFEECEQLWRIEGRLEDAMMLRTARASAAAALRMAELAALSAQHDLAEAAMLPATDSLPLPADLPHVGTYRTRFEELFSTGNLPARARLIHRTLPIRCRVIDVRAAAVRAAQDALEAAVDAYQLGRVDLGEVLSSVRRLGEQRRGLLASVSNYNHEIADYALSVAGPQTDEHVLVAMLILPSENTARPPVPEKDSSQTTRPAGVQDPSGSPSGVRPATLDVPVPSAGVDEPMSEALRGGLQSLGKQTPTLAPPREEAEPASTGEPPSATPSSESEQPVVETPAQAAPSEESESAEPVEAESAEPEVSETPMVPVPEGPSTPTSRTANKPVVDDQATSQSALGLYSALLEAKPAVRAKLLSVELHWARTLPEEAGESIELRKCLTGLSGADRRQVIAAYWLAAQRAAEYQALVAEISFLEGLVLTALERRNEPLGAEAMLELHAAKLATQADLHSAEVGLLDAQFQLTRCAGRPLDSPWLVPATAPHPGPYLLKLEAQPRELVETWPLRRLAALIPALSAGLEERAAAVVQADAARAAATAAYRAGSQPIAPALASITHQGDETRAFLEMLTKYNEAIADYALAVLPSTIPGEQLAGTLVVIR